jgi:type I restriction enzyme S subunit
MKLERKKFIELFDFKAKSKIQAKDGLLYGNYPFYTSSNIQSKFINEYNYEGECLIFGTGGKASIHFEKGKFSTSTDCLTAQAIDKNQIDVNYVFYYLKSNPKILEDGFHGAGLKHISKSYISDILIPLPPLTEQIRISKLLEQAESLLGQRKQGLDLLNELLKSTFLEMFGDPIKNPKKFINKQLQEVCIKITDGTHFSPPILESGIPYITAKHVRENKIDFWAKPWFISEEDHREIYKRCTPVKGDVLYIKDGATTGYAAINKYDFEFSMLSSLALLKVNSKILNSEYLCAWLNNEVVKKKILEGMSGGAIQRLTLTKINKLSINIAPIELQYKFAQVVEKIEELKNNYNISLIELQNLFGALCQEAFKKELHVSEPSTVSKKPSEDKKQEIVKTKNSKVEEIEPLETRHFLVQEALANKIKKKFKNYHFSFEMLINFLKSEDDYTVNYYSTGEMNNDSSLKKENDLKHFIQTSIVNVEMDEKQKGNVNPYLQVKQFFYNAKTAKLHLKLTREDQKLIKQRSLDEITGIYFEII